MGTILQAQDRVPVLVELFTSEGCSSCPAADTLLAELDSRQPVNNAELLVLSEHVDYWNQLGWRDPFSSAAFSERQQGYADRLHADDVFTPQVVVDGRYSTVGSNRGNLLKAIESSTATAKPKLDFTISREANQLIVNGPDTSTGEVWAAVTESGIVSHVTNGENAGRTLRHVGVVRSLTKLRAGQARIAMRKDWGSDLRLVVFVQDKMSGRISQAAEKHI
jgi:hypothetical protein